MNNAFKLTPCGPPSPCDYDCDSDDDITDQDFAVLMKEAAKGENVNEKTYKDLDTNKEETKGKKGKEGKEGKEDKEGNETEDESSKIKDSDEGQVKHRGKKRPCRKIIKNPFFTNRIKFSTDLLPPPPVPPPQFLPLADEDSKPKVCPKKKKCKKKKKKTKCNEEVDDAEEMCNAREEREEKIPCNDPMGKASEDDSPCECICDEKPDFESDSEALRARRHCKTSKNKKAEAPCRKKDSNTSILPQPQKIFAYLKDLPLTCPKNIPEVERQIWMSCDKNLQRNGCNKTCKKKERVKQLLNQ